jgi:RimJ/RimL family protein N-acetyltransferase
VSYSVRRVRPDDWAAFRALRLAALLDSPENFGSTYEDTVALPDAEWQARTLRNATSAESAFYVAVDDASGAFVGMWGVVPHLGRAATMVVVGVFVVAGARGTDVAARLDAACVEFAHTTDAEDLILDVRDGNDRARRFYERQGWVLTGESKPDEKDPGHVLDEMRYGAFRHS